MATEYSLITWAGLGTTVTFTDAGDIVNFTSHGAPNGHAFRFTTTGALPTGLTAGTTYYLRAGADANKFLVYPTQADAIAGTNQVTFSGTGSGTHMVVGEYWSALGTEARARYGTAGSERVYKGFYDLETYLIENRDPSKNICIEIQGKWDDSSSFRAPKAYQGFYSLTIHTKINGVRDSASFHAGVISGGFRRIINTNSYAAFQFNMANYDIDGLEIINRGTTGGWAIRPAFTTKGIIRNNLLSAYCGMTLETKGSTYYNNVAYGCGGYGYVFVAGFGMGDLFYNNMAVGCGVGFSGNTTTISTVINCLSYNNTTNWSTAPTGAFLGYNNAGVSGDTPWDSGSSTAITNIVADDFDANYKPASGSAHQVNTGTSFAGILAPLDMLSNVRPNYESASYPDNLWDIGPFEYDHGEGLAPSSVTISITGMANGSEFAIYKASDMSVILAPQSTSGSYSGTYTYTGDTNIIVRVRKGTSVTRYLPYEYAGTITSTGFQLVVSQIPDTIAQ